MTTDDLLADAFSRIHDVVHHAVDGLTAEQLAFRPAPEANSIAWLVWHLTRVQDDHVSDLAGREQVWMSADWAARFGLPLDSADTGYGHSSQQVAHVTVGSGELLTGYFDAVHQQTIRYVRELADKDLDRVVDASWDPPVTLGVRLVSVLSDDLLHAGQADYLHGLVIAQ